MARIEDTACCALSHLRFNSYHDTAATIATAIAQKRREMGEPSTLFAVTTPEESRDKRIIAALKQSRFRKAFTFKRRPGLGGKATLTFWLRDFDNQKPSKIRVARG